MLPVPPNLASPDIVLDPLPANILFDIARNDSAPHAWRKAATKFLLLRGAKQAKSAELVWFVREIEKDAEAEKEVSAIVESAIEEELVVTPAPKNQPVIAVSFDDND